MAKIAMNNFSFYYEDYFYPVFEHVNLVLDTDWKLGLIGRNGRGKSTLLKLLLGEITPTGGNISTSVNMEYFPYTPDKKYSITMDVVKETIGGFKFMEERMEALIADYSENCLEEYSRLQARYAELGGYEMEGHILKEMAQMGLEEELAYRDFETLSGGERTRMMIIVLFLRRNSFVLLDEPLNYMDVYFREQLEKAILESGPTLVFVEHDSRFGENVSNKVLELGEDVVY